MAKNINKLKSSLLISKLIIITGYYVIKSITIAFINKIIKLNNLNNISNKIIINWANDILKQLNINFYFQNWDIIKNLPENKPIILLSNHSSLLDIPIIVHAIHRYKSKKKLRMLAKRELLRIPLFGRALLCLGFPVIDRKNRTQAKKDLEYTKNLMLNNTIIWAAPEGTRSLTGELLKFKKGIFITAIDINAIIIPISIKNANKILPAKSYSIKTLNQTVILTAHEPIKTLNYTLDNKEELINITRKSIIKNI